MVTAKSSRSRVIAEAPMNVSQTTQYTADSFEVLQGRVVDVCALLHTTGA